MRKILSVFMLLVVSFCFIGNVNAEELSLIDVAALSTTIGGFEKEITLIDTENTYKLYYKYVSKMDKLLIFIFYSYLLDL